MSIEKLDQVAQGIADHVLDLHADYKPRRWNPVAGQWLVYGFERVLGFASAACLEAAVERAWCSGQDVKAAALAFLTEEFADRLNATAGGAQ